MTARTLRRYTGLVAAVQMLRKRAVTLLSPTLWDDKNDAHSLNCYRNAVGAKRVLALCLAEHYETYHHWKIYAPGPEGVCIEFDRDLLISAFRDMPTVKHRKTDYWTIERLRGAKIRSEDLPFIKRFPYGDEEEFRIVYTDDEEEPPYKDFHINIDCVTRINLSPWMHPSVDASLRETIRSIPGCEHARINRSRLVDYEAWKACIDSAFLEQAG